MDVLLGFLLMWATSAQAETQVIHFPQQARIQKLAPNQQMLQMFSAKIEDRTLIQGQFQEINVPEFSNARAIGSPELPVKSMVLVGHPDQLQVNVRIHNQYILERTRPMPAQPEACRCPAPAPAFEMNEGAFSNPSRSLYETSYLGAFRGVPLTRVDIPLATYDARNNSVIFNTEAVIEHNSEEFKLRAGDYHDYLIIVPAGLEGGLQDFIAWKQSLGFNMSVETITSVNGTLDGVKAIVRDYYTNRGTDFVMIVGDESQVPQHVGSSRVDLQACKLEYSIVSPK